MGKVLGTGRACCAYNASCDELHVPNFEDLGSTALIDQLNVSARPNGNGNCINPIETVSMQIGSFGESQNQYSITGKVLDFVTENADAAATAKAFWHPEFEIHLEEDIQEGEASAVHIAMLIASVKPGGAVEWNLPGIQKLQMRSAEEANQKLRAFTEEQLIKRCQAIAGEISEQVKKLKINNDRDKYEELILNRFDSVFRECPTLPHTGLSRQGFEKKYGSLHRYFPWSKVCKRFHGGISDPLSKSDIFLQIMQIIRSLWLGELIADS
eukprot:gnl/MRDRNA2_/MRDRNA2_131261_c0_seq1.p1 gnl/MRDRNA2_/MRDRNA2_131261_c0~~gnl/MRDRNA2_/MRDRNA2_131261_c0_seq1.p1  ORF type:complete len:269 (-),score=45.54 gnl/MRDRNA2_/MRDRNA2_131261_c0_seq1:371-1177(-)